MRNTIIVISALAGVLVLTAPLRSTGRTRPSRQQSAASDKQTHQHQNDGKSADQASGATRTTGATTATPTMPDMPRMDMGGSEKSPDNHAESGAMRSMQPGHHMMDGAHMHM